MTSRTCEKYLGPEEIHSLDPQWLVEKAFADWKPRGYGILFQCAKTKPYTSSPIYRRFITKLRRAGLWPLNYDIIFASDGFCLVPLKNTDTWPFNCYDLGPEQLNDPQHKEYLSRLCQLAFERLAGMGVEGPYLAIVVKAWWELASNFTGPVKLVWHPYRSRWTDFDRAIETMRSLFSEKLKGWW